RRWTISASRSACLKANRAIVASRWPFRLFGGFDQPLDLVGGQVLAGAEFTVGALAQCNCSVFGGRSHQPEMRGCHQNPLCERADCWEMKFFRNTWEGLGASPRPRPRGISTSTACKFLSRCVTKGGPITWQDGPGMGKPREAQICRFSLA